MRNQRTLRNAFVLHGIEPYGGCEVQFIMSPAPKDTGRVFQTKKGSVQARLENAYACNRSIFLRDPISGITVGHVEHVLATCQAFKLDNVYIGVARTPSRSFRALDIAGLATAAEVVPIFPQREKPICDAIYHVGLLEQESPARTLTIKKSFGDEKLYFTPILEGLKVSALIGAPYPVEQELELEVNANNYTSISSARPYAAFVKSWMPEWFVNGVPKVLFPSYGLGHGFSKDNVLVAQTREQWEREERVEKEVAAHTIKDRLGAIALLGADLYGVHLRCSRSGHENDLDFLKRDRDYFVRV